MASEPTGARAVERDPGSRSPADALILGAGVAVGLGILFVQGVSVVWLLVLGLVAAVGMAALTVADASRIALALILLDIPLQLDTHLFYRPEAELMGTRGGVTVSITAACALFLLGFWVIRRPLGRHASFSLGAPTLLLAAYLAVSITSTLVAADRAYAAFELSLMLPAFFVHLYIATQVDNREDLVFVWSILMAGLALEGTLILVTQLAGQDLNFLPGLSTTLSGGEDTSAFLRRAEGTLASPNAAASYIVLLLAPAAGLLVSDVPRRLRRLALAGGLLGGLALILTRSRGAWAGGLMSLAVMAVIGLRRGWLSPRRLALLGAVLFTVFVAFSWVIVPRLIGPDEGSALSRIPLMRIAFQIIREHPLLGVGINNIGLAMSEFRVTDFGGEWLFQVHNKYLLVWAETGTFGLLAFLGFLGATFYTGARVARSEDPAWAPVSLGLVAALVAHSLHMLVDSFTGRAQVQLLWVVAALLVSMHRVAERRTSDLR